MRFVLLLVLSSLAAFNLAIKKKPKYLKITAENQWEFGVPIGTVLKLDKHTRLYQPPPITDDFTPDNRIKLMWSNKNTNKNYCKVGPSIESAHIWYDFFWHQWCKNSTSHNICCKGYTCSCNALKANCACLSPEGFEYWERKKEVDWNNVKQLWKSVKNLNVVYKSYKHFSKSGKKIEKKANLTKN